jgi:hypothetical protein
VSEDAFKGREMDPASLHKYLYANADPLYFIDPSGNFSLGEISITIGIATTLCSSAGYYYTRTAMGAFLGGATGATLGVAWLGGPELFIRTVASGAINVIVNVVVNSMFQKPPMSRNEILQSFSAGTLAGLSGGLLLKTTWNNDYLVNAMQGALSSAISNYKSGQNLKTVLLNAFIGAGTGIIVQGGVNMVINYDSLPSLISEPLSNLFSVTSSAWTEAGKEILQKLSPDIYKYLFNE